MPGTANSKIVGWTPTRCSNIVERSINGKSKISKISFGCSIHPRSAKENMSFFINHELEYFCVNKGCEDLDKIIIFYIDNITETRTKPAKTPKCPECNRQVKGSSRTKDLIVAYGEILKANYFNKWEEFNKLACNGPLKRVGWTDKGIPIQYCEVCEKVVYGYNHKKVVALEMLES